jgi:hypothetical protein
LQLEGKYLSAAVDAQSQLKTPEASTVGVNSSVKRCYCLVKETSRNKKRAYSPEY